MNIHTEWAVSKPCECVTCCNGDHPGKCRECAGWGDRMTDDLSGPCEYCGGTGVCPVCHGENEEPGPETEGGR